MSWLLKMAFRVARVLAEAYFVWMAKNLIQQTVDGKSGFGWN